MCHAESGGKEEDGSGGRGNYTKNTRVNRNMFGAQSKMSVYFDANHERAR